MNKTGACIKLIQLLSTRNDFISTNELSELLDINPRNIKEYIKELEVAGYVLESRKGIYGGYKLKTNIGLPVDKISSADIENLKRGSEYLASASGFAGKDEYFESIGKITGAFETEKKIMPQMMTDKFPINMDKDDLQKRYQILSESIDDYLKCEIIYSSVKNVSKKHVIHPYKLYVYNGAWFILAFDEDVEDFTYFKLNRIEQIFKTKSRFTLVKSYKESDYLDEFGMTKNREFYPIVLEITGLNTYIQERVYGKNQTVEVIDENKVKLSCEMASKDMIKSFVLSFGTKAKVISPDWLINDIKNEVLAYMDMYGD